jgi:hypothetical protein
MRHDNLCLTPEPVGPICLSCATIENVREDEHYRIVEKLGTLPTNTSLKEVIEFINP